jgi:hypothetical protein
MKTLYARSESVKTPPTLRPLAAVAIVFLCLFASRLEAHSYGGGGGDREVIFEWNQAALANTPASAGVFNFRYQAVAQIAMFDAINSIQGGYKPYRAWVPAFPAASPEAAAAQAARDVLVALLPAGTPAFDTLLANRLATIPKSRAAQGVAVGRKVAKAILEWRTADGFDAPNLAYLPPPLPGLWQPTAAGQVAAFVQFGQVEPFGLLTPTQYLPAPPPQLNSPEYATAVEQVKSLGAVGSTTRTADQTLVARLIAGVGYGPGPFGLWSAVAQNVARSRNLSLIETARLFAMLGAVQSDSLQTSHSSKYVYGLWRPITAIRRAGEDLNDLTIADPTWTPLIATPAYPSHSSNVACLATGASRTLARIFKSDSIPFSVVWAGASGSGNANVTRTYSSFSQLAEEAGLARVWGGIHFSFELDASHEACANVADYLADNYMERIW